MWRIALLICHNCGKHKNTVGHRWSTPLIMKCANGKMFQQNLLVSLCIHILRASRVKNLWKGSPRTNLKFIGDSVKLGYNKLYGTTEICLLLPWDCYNREGLCSKGTIFFFFFFFKVFINRDLSYTYLY